VGLIVEDCGELHAAQSLEQEVGGAIFILLARADDARRGHAVRGFVLAGFDSERLIEPGHGKDATGRQHITQHLPVARFENMQRSNACGNSTVPGNVITGIACGRSSSISMPPA
jgi:hypothetical protein